MKPQVCVLSVLHNPKTQSLLLFNFPLGTESGSDSTSVMSTTSENDELWPSERLDAGSEWSSINTSRRSSVDAQVRGLGSPGSQNFLFYTKTFIFPLQSRPENLCNLGQRNEEDIKESLAAKERLLAKKYNLEEVLGIKSVEDSKAENSTLEPSQSFVNEESSAHTLTDCEEETHSTEKHLENPSQTLTSSEGLENSTDDKECLEDDKMTSSLSSVKSDSSQQASQHPSLTLDLTSKPVLLNLKFAFLFFFSYSVFNKYYLILIKYFTCLSRC